MKSSEPKLSSGQVVNWKDQEIPTVYANLMGINMTPFDISMTFGEIGESTPTVVNGIPRARVILSPEQAANLMKLLVLVLKTYTENNGALRSAGALDMEALAKDVKAQIVNRTK